MSTIIIITKNQNSILRFDHQVQHLNSCHPSIYLSCRSAWSSFCPQTSFHMTWSLLAWYFCCCCCWPIFWIGQNKNSSVSKSIFMFLSCLWGFREVRREREKMQQKVGSDAIRYVNNNAVVVGCCCRWMLWKDTVKNACNPTHHFVLAIEGVWAATTARHNSNYQRLLICVCMFSCHVCRSRHVCSDDGGGRWLLVLPCRLLSAGGSRRRKFWLFVLFLSKQHLLLFVCYGLTGGLMNVITRRFRYVVEVVCEDLKWICICMRLSCVCI